jgi:hypothetical protein
MNARFRLVLHKLELQIKYQPLPIGFRLGNYKLYEMVRIFLFFVLLTNGINCFGQVPDYLGNNPRWRQRTICNNGICFGYDNFVYHLNGDSVVGAYTYKKVYRYGEITSYPVSMGFTCPPLQAYNQFEILIRQEGKKMFVVDEGIDTLLYDFDLSVGDTLPQTFNNWGNNVVVESIDSILINGEYRRIFYWNNPTMFAQQMIEGIGSNFGLLEQMGSILECGYELFCHEYNGVNYFGDSTCVYNLGIDEPSKMVSFTLYPVPAQSEVHVQLASDQQIEKVELIDAQGRVKRLSFVTTSDHLLKIDLHSINQGIYFVLLTNSDGHTSSNKLIVE